VSGFISANTNWTLIGSPYIVVNNALLSNGYTLTIDPGVVVKFNDSCALQIDGELIAIGTAQNRITFTSNKPVPAAGDWAKVHFADLSTDAVFDPIGNYLSGSIMKYCDVLYGGKLGFGEVHIESSSPYLSYCNILNSGSAGVYSNQSSHTIDSSSIKNCNGYGLYYWYNSGNCIINKDTIANNLNGGIFSGLGFIRVIGNYFTLNTSHGAILIDNGNQNIFIRENYFANNTSNTGIIQASVGLQRDTICNNIFEYNQSAKGAINCEWSHFSSPRIYNNCFYQNTSILNGTTVLTIDNIGSYDTTYIFNNNIRNNSGVSGNCFKVRLQFDNNQLMNIYNNNFIDNTGFSVLNLNQWYTTAGTLNYLCLKRNNFSNPNSQYELYNNIEYGSQNVFADSNYWGSTNTQHIDSVIYDYFDFANQSVVYYMPILPSPSAVDTTCAVIIPTSINNIELPSALVLFPNPAATHLTITFNKNINNGVLEMYNILGAKVLKENIYHVSKKEINLKTISNGIYLVKLFDGERYYCRKIIVKHN